MKRLSVALALFCAILCSDCAQYATYQGLIDTGAAVGITMGLQYGVKDASRRAEIANYSDTIAAGIRTITGTPTPAQLTQSLLSFLPAQVRSDYPEIATLVVPLVVGVYQAAYQKYGQDTTKIYAILTELATVVENGDAPFVSHS